MGVFQPLARQLLKGGASGDEVKPNRTLLSSDARADGVGAQVSAMGFRLMKSSTVRTVGACAALRLLYLSGRFNPSSKNVGAVVGSAVGDGVGPDVGCRVAAMRQNCATLRASQRDSVSVLCSRMKQRMHSVSECSDLAHTMWSAGPQECGSVRGDIRELGAGVGTWLGHCTGASASVGAAEGAGEGVTVVGTGVSCANGSMVGLAVGGAVVPGTCVQC